MALCSPTSNALLAPAKNPQGHLRQKCNGTRGLMGVIRHFPPRGSHSSLATIRSVAVSRSSAQISTQVDWLSIACRFSLGT